MKFGHYRATNAYIRYFIALYILTFSDLERIDLK